QAPDGEEYIVQADDWLSTIAEKQYGDPLAYPAIVEATNAKAAEDDSFAVIDNPDVIEIGQKLWLPTEAGGSTLPPAPASESLPASETAPEASIAAEGLGDSYFPLEGNPGYDVQHYTIELTVDPATVAVDATTTIDALATANLDNFNLDFLGYEISAVTVDGAEAEFSRDGQELTITPSASIAEGAAFSTAVRYAGVAEPYPDPSFIVLGDLSGQDFSNGLKNWGDGIVSAMSQPDGAMTWFPANNHPTDRATYSYRLTVDAPNVAAANGVLQEVIPVDDDTNTYVFEMNDPMATQVATVLFGQFDRFESVAPNGVPIRNYFPVGTDQAVIDSFDATGEMMTFLSDLLGDYPFDVYGIAFVPGYLGGTAYEAQTLSVFDDYEGIIEGATLNTAPEEVILHELAHQWFGNSVNVADWSDIWLHEGFARYTEALWFEETQGVEAYNAYIESQYETHVSYGPLYTFLELAALQEGQVHPPTDPTVQLMFLPSYTGGALALHNLRMEVGDEVFFDLLRTYYQRYQGQSVATEEFITTAEEVAGRDLSDWADIWLYSNDIPADFPRLGEGQ
ncbi:MAG: hypothetical protein KDJ65_35645, partial [Anaerolineae bacterium]|nr:hypothetical protein [Anaerolineae bacterium]